MIISFFNFFFLNWNSAVEIIIIAMVIYYIYLYLRGTHGAKILISLAIIFLTLTFISQILNLAVIGWMLRGFSVFLAVALVVIFQPELRRALTELGTHHWFAAAYQHKETIELIVDTVFELSSKGLGALIAIEREIDLRQLVETGVEVDAKYSTELVLTIFYPKTVLHDGGVIVKDDRVAAAGCIFPVTQREDLNRNLGLRHRAGLGLAEESDAICIVVSEETGQVSICHDGQMERNLSLDTFRRRLQQLILLEKYEKADSQQLAS